MDWSSGPELAGAAIALVASLLSIALYRMTRHAEDERSRTARMPVLVLSYRHGGLRVTNVGVGPAVNVFLACWKAAPAGPREMPITRFEPPGSRWVDPVHLEPIPPGASAAIPATYLGGERGQPRFFGVFYTDPVNFPYLTKSGRPGTIVCPGRQLPQSDRSVVPYPAEIGTRSRPWLAEVVTACDRPHVLRPLSRRGR